MIDILPAGLMLLNVLPEGESSTIGGDQMYQWE
jgi:hypothetical protein